MEVSNLCKALATSVVISFNVLHILMTGQEAISVEINTIVIYKYSLKNRMK